MSAGLLTVPALGIGTTGFDHRYPADPLRAGLTAIGLPPASVPRQDVVVQVAIRSLGVLAQALPTGSLVGSGSRWTLRVPIVIAAKAQLYLHGPSLLQLAPGSYIEVAPGGSAHLTDMSITATASKNNGGFIAAAGGRLILENDQLNGLGRLTSLGYGVSFVGAASGSAVLGTTIRNGLIGIYASASNGLVIRGNRIIGSRIDGIELHGQVARATVTRNSVSNSGLHGIVLAAGVTDTGVTFNSVVSAAEHGILLYNGGTRDSVVNNTVKNCLDGIVLTDASGDVVRGNVVSRSRRFALRVSGTSAANTIMQNRLYGGAVGAYLLNGAHANRLIGNLFASNGENVRIRRSAPGNVVRPIPRASELWSQ